MGGPQIPKARERERERELPVMPGPGPYTMYTLGTGGILRLTRGRFSPQHRLFYALNAFGPDLGPFAQWITASVLRLVLGFGSVAMALIHHPFYYVLVLGLPLSFFYSWLSSWLLCLGFIVTFFSWIICLRVKHGESIITKSN